MKTTVQTLIALMVAMMLVAACGGGGGGNRAAGVEPGPTEPGGPVAPPEPEPPRPIVSYAEAEEIRASITGADIPDDGRTVIDFQLTDGNGTALTDLTIENVDFVVVKLQASELGGLTGSWQSYVNAIEQPGVGPGTEPKLQATREASGDFTNNGDGTYRYRYSTDVNNLPADIMAQAETEGLDLTYENDRTHRVSIQFDGSNQPANPVYDWVPATGATDNIFHYDVAATENCNRCHDPIALHGGGRVEVKYCTTCHNPGSSDANSGNSVDMKVMIHKIHRGKDLPSVQAGGEYAIWGFRDTKHDYSDLAYPQDIRSCENCHAGTATGNDDLVLTSEGDNWTQYSSRATCGSCHDDVVWEEHKGGQPDDSRCGSCHSPESSRGPEQAHRILTQEASAEIIAEILAISSTAPGQFPQVDFRVYNSATGEDYDVLNDPTWTEGSLNVTLSWSTADYHNTGNGKDYASSVSVSASTATANGDGSFNVVSSLAIPDGSLAPFIAAEGSGAAVIEGRASVELEEGQDRQTVPLVNVHEFFSISDDGVTPRRSSVELNSCLSCHQSLSLHGSNRTDNIDSCVTCHNPRNTDRQVREIASSPPTDGKDEESIDFKTMVHAIHAAGMREEPLQIVGYRGFSTHVYDEEHVHYPGNIGNCSSCHGSEGFELPLASTVLGTTVDTGDDFTSPVDDLVITPVAAVCSSCHDDATAKGHMETNGASFSTSQDAIDTGAVLEQCDLCHASGRSSAVESVHPVR